MNITFKELSKERNYILVIALINKRFINLSFFQSIVFIAKENTRISFSIWFIFRKALLHSYSLVMHPANLNMLCN